MATSCSLIFYRKSLRLGQAVPICAAAALYHWGRWCRNSELHVPSLFLNLQPPLQLQSWKKYHDMHQDSPLGPKMNMICPNAPPAPICTLFTNTHPQSGSVDRRDCWEVVLSFCIILPFFQRIEDSACLSLLVSSLENLMDLYGVYRNRGGMEGIMNTLQKSTTLFVRCCSLSWKLYQFFLIVWGFGTY